MMGKLAIIESGKVANVLVGDEFLGAITCDDAVQIGWSYDGTAFSAPAAPAAPAPAVMDVEAERSLRLSAGFDYDFGDARGVHHIGTTDQDMVGWDDVTKLANAQIGLGNGAAAINIVTNTGPVTVTATEWLKILVAAGDFRQPIWAASFALEAMDPIPADYAADSHWTAT